MRTVLKLLGLSLLTCVMLALAACGGASTSAPTAAGGQSAAAPAANPAPDFNAVAKGTDKLFVPVDTVKKAFDDKSDVLIVDARAPSDFAAGHIPGAVNIPYYDMAKRYSEVPKDKWIITYCACPHAEAEEAARQLVKNGYTKVKVMDEGYFGWVDKKYPVEKKNG